MRTRLLLLCLLIFSVVAAQEPFVELNRKREPAPSHTLVVYFNDKSQVPVINKLAGRNAVPEINSKDNSLLSVYKKNKLIKVEQAFPSAVNFQWHPLGVKLLNYYLLTFEAPADSALDQLKSRKSKFIESKEIYREPQVFYEPNDYTLVPGGSYTLDFIRAKDAWNITNGNPAIKIGISDIDFDTTCSELVGKTEFLALGLNNTGGHGTRVATLAAGKTDNGGGLASIGFNCSLVVTTKGYDGILDAVYRGAKVVNCSWGSPTAVNATYDYSNPVIDLVTSLGVTVVASAGNWYIPPGQYFFPASYNNVISVSSVGHINDIGEKNNYCWKDVHDGRPLMPGVETFTHNDRVDICAPAHAVISNNKNNGYSYGWGTSFSAPLVTGTVALLYSVKPDIRPNEVEEILKCSAVNIDSISYNRPYAGQLGAGRLDAGAAAQLASNKLRMAKPQDITWYGIENNVQKIIEQDQFSNYSSLAFKVVDAGAAANSVYEWQINSLTKIIYKTGSTITVTLAELGLAKGNACQHLEVGVRKGTGCTAGYYYFEKKLCAKADFDAIVSSGEPCNRSTVHFLNRSVDGETFLWNFGDGTTSTEKHPVHLYSSPGKKNVTLTVNGSLIKTGYVTINAGKFSVNGEGSNIYFCINQPTVFNYFGGNCGGRLLWNFGDGSTSYERTPTHVYTGKGPFNVTLDIDNLYTVSQQIIGRPVPVDFDISPAAATCSNNKFNFSIPNITCATSFNWDFGNGKTSNTRIPGSVDFDPGTYTVKLTMNGSIPIVRELKAGGAFANFTYKSNLNTNTGESFLIAGIPINFKDESVCATSYQWNFGDGTTSDLQNPVKTYSNAGTYTVRLYINGNADNKMERIINVSCGKAIDVSSENVTDNAAKISWNASAPAGSFVLQYRKTGGNAWTVKGNVTSPYTITGLTAGTRYDYLIYTLCNNGTATSSDSYYFLTGSPCNLASQPVTAGAELNGPPCSGSSLQLKATYINGSNYQWTGPNSFSSTSQNPVVPNVTTANSGTYTCKVMQGACLVNSADVNVVISTAPVVPTNTVTNTITGNTAVLNWSIPGNNINVTLQYKTAAGSTWTSINNVTAPYTLAGLALNTSYNWRVKASITTCSSDWSIPVNFTTDRNCSPPLNNQVSGITNASAIISWSAIGSQVPAYQLSYRLAGSTTAFTIFNNSVTGTNGTISIPITGLAPATRYEYRITPKCLPGNQLSTLYTSGDLTTADCARPILNPVSGITDNSARINWVNIPAITALKIEIRPAGATDYIVKYANLPIVQLYAMITGLIPGTTYDYKVTPLCGPGYKPGTTSAAGTFTTLYKICSGTTVQTACTGSISDGSGTGNHNNNMNCAWLVSVPGATSLTLKFTSFSTENSNDVVSVYKGSYAYTSNLIGKYSGNIIPAPLTISGSAMYISFTTNASVAGPGWEAKYYSSLCPAPASTTPPVTDPIVKNEGEKLINRITLHPNPYLDNIIIEMEREIQDAELILTGENGSVAYKKHYDIMQKTTQLNFGTTLMPADYILTIRNNEEILYRQQLIRQRTLVSKPISIGGEELLISDILLYPNPYVDNFNIELKKELKNVVLLMMDLNGRVVYKREFAQMMGRTQIDLGNTLSAGVYLLVIRNTKEILFRQRVIAQK
ncbi:MAG: PKD domain-containing protein [Chitinophagaceae bacterium]